MSLMPAASSAATSAGPISVPFLSTSAPWRMVWTAVAPSASRGGTGPNFMTALTGLAAARCVISPMIATAISAGDTAPMSSPIGEWMRPMSLSVKPRSAFSRSTRRAWVFREPSAPM